MQIADAVRVNKKYEMLQFETQEVGGKTIWHLCIKPQLREHGTQKRTI